MLDALHCEAGNVIGSKVKMGLTISRPVSHRDQGWVLVAKRLHALGLEARRFGNRGRASSLVSLWANRSAFRSDVITSTQQSF